MKEPELLDKINDLQISTQAFIFDWFYTVYTRAFDITVVRAVWDSYIVLGDYYVFSFGISLFELMKEDLMSSSIVDGFNFIRLKTNKLPLSKIVKSALYKNVSQQKFDLMVTEEILKDEERMMQEAHLTDLEESFAKDKDFL